MQVLATPLWVQKAGNPPDEYEDAFYPEGCRAHVGDRLSFAVADGATEGMLSGRWAQLLTKIFKRHWYGPDQAEPWLARAYQDWARLKKEYIHQRELQRRPIQWYEEPGLEAGAFAALVGITLLPGEFSAVARGDSCLFQVRGDELLLQFPLARSDEFDDRPLLLSSNPARNRTLEPFKTTGGDLRPGDRFYLMTDALAAWFMRECEAGNTPWCCLDDLHADDGEESFIEWMAALREQARIRNDDVTCLRLQVI